MGVIVNQSFKNLIITYFGFGIGAINTLFLFTNFLEQEYYGLVSFLLSVANLIWPFMAFGVNSTIIKFFSSYKTKEEQDRLLNMMIFLPMAVSIVLGIMILVLYDFLLEYFAEGNELVQPYIWLIFVIACAIAYFEMFFSWSKLYFKSVFGNFMKEVFHRFCISALLLAVYLKWITVNTFIYCIAGVFVFRSIAMAIYALNLYAPKLNLNFPKNLSTVLKYSFLIFIASSVTTVLLDLDKVMIEYFLPIENVAVYGIGIYIATVISVPQKALHQIIHPMTARFLNARDRNGLSNLYKRSSVNLLIVSGIIFILIITNLKELYEMIPDQYELSVTVVLLISLVKLYDNMLGSNNSILFNSDYYRLVLGIGVCLAVLAFILNLIFIPAYGIQGAAIASFLAFFIYNTAKVYLVRRKFKIYPFTGKTWIILLFTAGLCAGFYFWEFPFHPIINIALKSLLICLIYLAVTLKFNFSEDINQLLGKYLKF